MLSRGVYPAHTGQQVAIGAGIYGMIVPFGSMMNKAPRHMNYFVGTGALNPLDRQDAFDMILYLNANCHIREADQGHYYDLARYNGRSLIQTGQSRTGRKWRLMYFEGGTKNHFATPRH
jgi:hypothetical protein